MVWRGGGAPGGRWVTSPRRLRSPLCVLICLPSLMQAGRRSSRLPGLRRGRWWCGLLACGFTAGTVTVAGNAPPAGELAVFCRPVVTAPAAVRRDGTVLADGWLPDLVRLGELERHLGDGGIEAAGGTALAEGRLKPRQRRRLMSYPLVIRLMIAMTLMPGASYCEALRRVAGLLADIPFTREWHVPTEKVVTDWRLPVPPDVMEGIFWQAAGRRSGPRGPPGG